MIKDILTDKNSKIALLLFLLLAFFWLLLQINLFKGQLLFAHSYHKFFGAIYGTMSLIGAIWGIKTAKKWGGIRSIMGKAIILFSLGLLAQEFGQASLSIIDYIFNIPGSYPSIGDIGFFGSIPLYILGVLYLAKASGVRIGLKSMKNKIQAIVIPLIILIIGYSLFLNKYEFDWSKPLKIFLDFGYPLGQATYISLTLLTYLLSRKVLGGVMKNKILLILLALTVQFIADYTFLFQTNNGSWAVGEINDFTYLIAYFLMTLGLLNLNIDNIKNKLN